MKNLKIETKGDEEESPIVRIKITAWKRNFKREILHLQSRKKNCFLESMKWAHLGKYEVGTKSVDETSFEKEMTRRMMTSSITSMKFPLLK